MSRQEQNEFMALTSFLQGTNAGYIEDLYAQYQQDPSSVSEDWQAFFAKLQDRREEVIKEAEGPSWGRRDWPPSPNGELISALDSNWGDSEKAVAKKIAQVTADKGAQLTQAQVLQATQDTIRVLRLVRAYRMRGHLAADLDPLGLSNGQAHPELDPKTYGFTEADMDRTVYIDNLAGFEKATVRQILNVMKKTYCSKIGVEYMHISDPEQRTWLQDRIEGEGKEINYTPEGKKAILKKLVEAETFEKFLDVKYTGTKRFGLDGGEAMVPALEQIIKRGGALGIREVVLGMPHRGRLNVLVNVMSKPYRALFHEFKGGSANPEDVEGSGDVKYHMGASSDREFDNNKVHLSLTANPSHLEIVDPVVLGKVRAKQDQLMDTERKAVLPLLLHGDAAFAGQGVVAECFGLSGLNGHRTGGSIHFIVNNQIGFTTSPHHSRSSPYPSDVARMIDAPILHVNGDDPESVVFCAKIAIEYRQQFGKPVVIDMFCYRRFGHNESDEPAFTQPLMYKKIRQHSFVTDIYGQKLVDEKVIQMSDLEAMRADYRSMLEEEFEAGNSYRPNKADWMDGAWSGIGFADDGARRGETGVDADILKEVGEKLTTIPENFNAHKTLQRVVKARQQMVETGQGIDWAMAEALAFGTLVREGFPVRLSGQDCERGTFSQRHSVFNDQETEEKYIPLNNISKDQANFEVINSMLSEEAVLGFEYGYTLAEPNALTLWEAQFGDFANGAQVVVDQFISAGERKWLRMSGLVMLLPHGYEGQGPEHSSARLERYLQLCAEDNMQVANCTTPANYFHILRRQLHRKFRKPLVLMTPKSLLRHKRVTSTFEEMGPNSTFHRVLWDDAQSHPHTVTVKLAADKDIKRVVLCSGKVYYDLLEEREKRGINDVYLMRLEQIYPFPARALMDELNRFTQAEVIWCQEEPQNMGSWFFVDRNIEDVLVQINAKHKRPRYVGRTASASTATGLMSKHLAQLNAFLNEALTV